MLNNQFSACAFIIFHLIRKDLYQFKEDFWGKFIDTSIMLFTSIVIFSYFLPSYGLINGYGPFILVGTITSFGFFEVIGKVAQMISDIEGDRTILYTISLPLPSWSVFFYFGISWAINSALLSILMFPLGKLFLFSEFNLWHINYLKFILIFIMSQLFFGFFALWLSSFITKMGSISHLFVRVINPMYSFGGYFYSWKTVYGLSKIFAYISLINPLIFVMEGMRVAILGQEGYISFWISFITLTIFTGLIAWDAIRKMKKRLDCI